MTGCSLNREQPSQVAGQSSRGGTTGDRFQPHIADRMKRHCRVFSAADHLPAISRPAVTDERLVQFFFGGFIIHRQKFTRPNDTGRTEDPFLHITTHIGRTAVQHLAHHKRVMHITAAAVLQRKQRLFMQQ